MVEKNYEKFFEAPSFLTFKRSFATTLKSSDPWDEKKVKKKTGQKKAPMDNGQVQQYVPNNTFEAA